MIKKIKDESIIKGYEVGNLKIVVQAIKDDKTGRLVKGVFCDLNVKKVDSDIKERISFVFALNSVPTFNKAVLSMINEAISLKSKESEKKK